MIDNRSFDSKYQKLDAFSKLLAVENIRVVFSSTADTAMFDIVNRKVIIPRWSSLKEETMLYLTMHEVGHALYTDPNFCKKIDELDKKEYVKELFAMVHNIVEDVRIERLIQRKYLGTSYYFKVGCKDLFTNKIEKIFQGKDEIDFLDRSNLYYKFQRYNLCKFNFTPDERLDLAKMDVTQTPEEVFELSKYMYKKYITPEKEDQWRKAVEAAEKFNQKLDQFLEDLLDGKYDGKEEVSGIEKSVFSEQISKMIEQKLKKLVENRSSKNKIQKSSPITSVSGDTYSVVSFKDTLDELDLCYANICDQEFDEYLRNINKSVNYMISLFEIRKRGAISKKIRITNSGTINPEKLYSYKVSDDVFRKRVDLPEGKNHGLMVFLDCSGSMQEIFSSAVDQCCLLAQFCKKINVPFRIFGFRDSDNNSNRVKLHTYLSSEASSKDNYNQIKNMFLLGKSITNNAYPIPYKHNLTGTPLVSTTINSIDMARNFKEEFNVDVMNLLYITDGEATDFLENEHDDFMSFNHKKFKISKVYTKDALKLKMPFYHKKINNFSSLVSFDVLKSVNSDINLLNISLVDDLESSTFYDLSKFRQGNCCSVKDCYPFDAFYFIKQKSMKLDSQSVNLIKNKHFINIFMDAFVGKI